MLLQMLLLLMPRSEQVIGISIGPFDTPTLHLVVVGAATALAALVCLLIIISAPTIRETRTIFLILAFTTISAVLLAHAMTTPGTLGHSENKAIHASAALSLVGGAFFAAMSATPMPLRPRLNAKLASRALVMVMVSLLLLYVSVAVAKTGWFDGWPSPRVGSVFFDWPLASKALSVALATPVLILFGFAGLRYFRAWRLTGQTSQWGLVVALGLLMETEVGIAFAAPWSLAWWYSHVLVVGSVAVLVASLAYEWRRAGSLRLFSHALLVQDGLNLVRRGYGPAVRELTVALSQKDPYTRGHTSRVAQYAYAIGQELDLPESRLEQLTLMGELHDIGKIGVPDRILLKPGALTAEEFELIKNHTVRGWLITKNIPNLRAALDGVRHHHERLDGKGYPDGLVDEQLSTEVRCLSVADVFDALTSSRSYRPAMEIAQAVRIVQEGARTAYDPRCVAALQSLARGGMLDEMLAKTTDEPDKISKWPPRPHVGLISSRIG